MKEAFRLIEDFLPIEAISKEASREKSVRKGHISTLHLWWARRPLVACRAAVYGALVPASQFVPSNGPANRRQSLGRANAAKFVERLCKYPGESKVIQQAQEHILQAHAERLSAELVDAARTGNWPAWVDELNWPKNKTKVTRADIEAGRAPRPRVLDMFAGGGSIPLEALRLGCEAYALELNPVAHIIELCTLVYPQKYGQPDPTVRGMTGPKNEKGKTTWGGLAEEVRWWGDWVLDRVRKEIGDLYPPIPDPEVWATLPEITFDRQTGRWKVTKPGRTKRGVRLEELPRTTGYRSRPLLDDEDDEPMLPPGFLQPVAYLWTRTVRCKNPGCGATVPLVRQTWLCKKKGRYVALRMVAPRGKKQVRFEVVESKTEKGLGFNPAGFSKGGNATCPFCGTVADSDYVKAEGCAKRMGQQMMAIVCTRPRRKGKVYLSADQYPEYLPDKQAIQKRIEELCQRTGLTVPNEPIVTDAKNSCWTHLYGLTTFGDLFTPRQMLCLLSFVAMVRTAQVELQRTGCHSQRVASLASALACVVDKQADFNSSLCVLKSGGGRGIVHTFGRQAIPMVWDFAEANPFNAEIACWTGSLKEVAGNLCDLALQGVAHVTRGSAMSLSWPDGFFDAVITDPPYYDNVPYADISDFFYVWLKRSIGHLYPEHFTTQETPKKNEAVSDATRHGGDKEKARQAYEQMMAQSFAEANRVLKAGGQMVVVYAHKTTLGWSSLVDALRDAGFTVTEAWPLDTETTGRLRAQESAALASSIFLVARKREGNETGSYEEQVRPELETIVRERVETLWEQGISGADLVIACVGAGLRAFTRFEQVEYANGEPVPAKTFLSEVEGVVLDTMFAKLLPKGAGRQAVSTIDPASRFYVLWRFVYRAGTIDAGEAIVFSYGQHVELEELASGRDALLEKKKGKYRLRDFTERGHIDDMGYPWEDGTPAPLIDVLHRVLWLVENSPRHLREYLEEVRPDRERLRVLAQALGGPALSGKSEEEAERLVGTTPAERSALKKLLQNWRSLIERAMVTPGEEADRRRGQQRLF